MQRLRVLMLSVDPRVPGGIAQFIETLKSRLTCSDVTHLSVGSIPGEHESPLSVFLRVVVTPIRVAALDLFGRYDVVHLNASLTPKSAIRDALILLALRLSGQRNVLLYIHGWRWDLAQRIARNRALRALANFLLAGTQRILVLAPEFRAALIAIGVDPARIEVTRTMFDSADVRPAAIGRPTRRRVLFMSRIERGKGVFELVEGFARISGRHPDVDLVLAGTGEALAEVRRMIAGLGLQERVMLPGYVRGAEKAALLGNCSVFVLPSYGGEGMPVALLEALAAGLPVITSRAGGIPHVIRDSEHGLMLDEITPEGIACALDEMLSRAAWWNRVGQANRRYAWTRFEAGTVSAEVEGIYRAIAGRV
jgi:glycosyltransferase involved in cell wall biosynthesis